MAMLVPRRVTGTFFQDFGELNQEAAGRNTSPKFRPRGTGARDFSACDGGGEKMPCG